MQSENPEKQGKIRIVDEEGTIKVHCKKLEIVDESKAVFTIDETVLSRYKNLVFKIGKKTITYNQVTIE